MDSDAMDVGGAKPKVPKTAHLAPGSTVQPKRARPREHGIQPRRRSDVEQEM